MDKIFLIQKEYKDLLLRLLPKLKSIFAPEALDEINLFWLRNINIVRLYLKTVFPSHDSYVFTATTFLDYDDNEHLPFLMIGKKHILDDPLSRYSEWCNVLPDDKDMDYLYKQIGITAEDNIKILENLNSIIFILPLRLLAQSDADDVLFQMSEQLFISLFDGIKNINEYFNKCNSIEDILQYACDNISEIIMFSETDNKTIPFEDRFKLAISKTEFMIDPNKSDAYNFFGMVFGNMTQAVSILACCMEYGCIPFIRYPVSFHYLNMIANNIMESEHIAVLQFKMSVAFVLHKLCNKNLLAEVGLQKLLNKIQSYKFNEKLFSRFNFETIVENGYIEHSLPQLVNEELECFYQHLSDGK